MAFRFIPPRALRLGLLALRSAGQRRVPPVAQPPRDDSGDASFFDPAPSGHLPFRPVANAGAFEIYCRDILAQAGWTASVLGGSGDQGCDIMAEMAGRRMVVQCKLYGTAVGNRAVQEVYAAQAHFRAAAAVVVCDAGFTPSARALAASTGVRLASSADLARLHLDFGLARRHSAIPAGRRGVRCLPCGSTLSLPAHRTGMVRCPTCGNRFRAST